MWGFGEPGGCQGRAPDVRSSPCTLAFLLWFSYFLVCLLQANHTRIYNLKNFSLLGATPNSATLSLNTRSHAVLFFSFDVLASAKPLPTMNRRRRSRRCRRRRRRRCITTAGVRRRKYAHTGSFAAFILQSQIFASALLPRYRPP